MARQSVKIREKNHKMTIVSFLENIGTDSKLFD